MNDQPDKMLDSAIIEKQEFHLALLKKTKDKLNLSNRNHNNLRKNLPDLLKSSLKYEKLTDLLGKSPSG